MAAEIILIASPSFWASFRMAVQLTCTVIMIGLQGLQRLFAFHSHLHLVGRSTSASTTLQQLDLQEAPTIQDPIGRLSLETPWISLLGDLRRKMSGWYSVQFS